MKRIKLILTLLFISVAIGQLSAQSECAIILREAQDTYDAGNLEEVKEMLYGCLESGFNKSEKIQAYRLIALTFLFDDKIAEARAAMYELLKIDPEFEINEVIDPVEFKELHKSFQTYPIYSVGLNGGINFSKINLMESYSVDNYNNLGTYTSNGIGYQFGLHGNVIIKQKFYANLDVVFKGTKYQFYDTLKFNELRPNTYNSDSLGNLGTLQASENHTWIGIPFSLTYDIPLKGKVSTYVRFGATARILLSAQSTFNREYEDKYQIPNVTGVPVDMKENRNSVNYGLTGGLGLKYKVTKGNLFIDVRYNHALKYANNGTNRYSNPELLYQYYYVDDDFKLNDLAISVGYTRHFYNPKLRDKEQAKAMDAQKSKPKKGGDVKAKKSKYKNFD